MESCEGETSKISAELRPLKLPEGIQNDELPKVIINVLLRRALFENNPLSKWILLGALEVLQGRSPKLTPTMLSQLVNLSEKSEEGNTPRMSMKKTLYIGKKTSNSIISESAGVQVNGIDKKKVADKSSQIKILPITKDIASQCVEILKENKEVQFKPTMHTKWIQVKHPKLVSNWAQTLIKEIKHNGTQTLQQNDVKKSIVTSPEDKGESLNQTTNYKINSPEDKRDSLKPTKTYKLNSPEDKRDSLKKTTNYKKTSPEDKGDSSKRITNYKELLKLSWKLVEVDVISKQRRVKNAIHSMKINETESNKYSNMISSSLKISPNDSIWDNSEDIPYFYGRPLIDKISKLKFEIPLKSKSKLLDPRLQFLDY